MNILFGAELSYAVAQPVAMMIHSINTFIASHTMVKSIWLRFLANQTALFAFNLLILFINE
jgi:hypothetical protein